VIRPEDNKGNLVPSQPVLVPDILFRRKQDRKTALFGCRQKDAVL
jgi:hypothetical protein